MGNLAEHYGNDSQTANSRKEFLLSDRTTWIGEEIHISFIPNAEFPFEVYSSRAILYCISWDEACDKLEHFYAYVGEPGAA